APAARAERRLRPGRRGGAAPRPGRRARPHPARPPDAEAERPRRAARAQGRSRNARDPRARAVELLEPAGHPGGHRARHLGVLGEGQPLAPGARRQGRRGPGELTGRTHDMERKRILVVEDDRFLRKAAEVTLKRHGYGVMTASDGEDALRVAHAERPDLVLLDLIMPRLQGFEVLRKLKEDAATVNIPVIVLSNLGQPSDVQQAIDGGAVAYLVK